MINEENLEKQIVYKEIGRIYDYNDNAKLLWFKAALTKLEKQAKKEGYIDLKIDFGHESGDDNNLDHIYLSLNGSRLETEEEWHKRLERRKNTFKRDLEDAQRESKLLDYYSNKINIINNELEKSTLRCEKCGCLCSYTTKANIWKKGKRVCYKCMEKINEKNNK